MLIVLAALESALEVALPARPGARADDDPLVRRAGGRAASCCRCSAAAASRSPRPRRSGSLGAALSFVDGRLVVFTASPFIAGMAAAFLLGNLRDDAQARVGLAIVLGGAAIVVYNNPDHAPGELVFTPVLFGIGWLAGFALRERGAARRGGRAARARRPSGSARRRRASPSPRSGRASRASSTTSSPTPSA